MGWRWELRPPRVDHPAAIHPTLPRSALARPCGSWGLVRRGKFPEPSSDMVKHSPSLNGRILHTRTLWQAASIGRLHAARVPGAVPVAGGARLANRHHLSRRDLTAGTGK